jgi:hypothetical protein
VTSLTLLEPEYSYGDVVTLTNNGGGLTTTLSNIQDGLGNNSTVQLSTIAANFSRAGANTFQLDGTAVTATVDSINSMCATVPTLLPLAADPVGANGMIYYNTLTNHIRVFVNGSWEDLL